MERPLSKRPLQEEISSGRDNIIQNSKLYVGNLHPSTSEGDLIKIFQQFGTVKNVAYVWHKVGPLRGQPRGFAFVEMSTIDEARTAANKLHKSVVRGRKIIIGDKESEVNESTTQHGKYTIGSKRPLSAPSSSADPVESNIKRIRMALQKME